MHPGEQQVVGIIQCSLPAGGEDVRAVVGQLFQIAGGAEPEHAAVPQILARTQVVIGSGRVWLLDEAADAEGAVARRFALLDIAITGLRRGGYYRSEEHTSELQSRENIVCRLLLEKKNKNDTAYY